MTAVIIDIASRRSERSEAPHSAYPAALPAHDVNRLLSGLPPRIERPVSSGDMRSAGLGDPQATGRLIRAVHPNSLLHLADWLRCKKAPGNLWVSVLDAGLALVEEERLIHPFQLLLMLAQSSERRGDGLPDDYGDSVDLYRAGLTGSTIGWVSIEEAAEADRERRIARGQVGGVILHRTVPRSTICYTLTTGHRTEIFVSPAALGIEAIGDWPEHPLARTDIHRRTDVPLRGPDQEILIQ